LTFSGKKTYERWTQLSFAHKGKWLAFAKEAMKYVDGK
jgi:hypothetical protein